MKNLMILSAAAIGLALATSPLRAQAENGNNGPQTGGSTVNPGTASASTAFGQRSINGGQNTAGGTQAAGSVTNAPSGAEFHPPTTSPGANQR